MSGHSLTAPGLAHTPDDMLPILAVTSSNYAHVFSFWQSSLDLLEYPTERRHVRNLGSLEPPFGYCTESWRYAIDQQLIEVTEWIAKHQGEYFLHTDTDIQFFPRFLTIQAEWLQWMREEKLDMLFMRERTHFMPELREGEVNAGFYIVHCNERTLEFWQQVLAMEQQHPKMDGYPPYTDQYHLNRGLTYRRDAHPQIGEFGVRWAVIPDEQCIWSLPSSEQEMLQAAFHHAVNTQDKPELLQRVRDMILEKQALPQDVRCQARWDTWVGQATMLTRFVRDLQREVPPCAGIAMDLTLRLQQLSIESHELVKILSAKREEVHSSAARCEGCRQSSFLRQADDGHLYCAQCWRGWFGTDLPRDPLTEHRASSSISVDAWEVLT